jgi:hypothetical protein
MAYFIKPPQINGISEKEQLAQVHQYLYQLSEQLSWMLNDLEAGKTVVYNTPKSLANTEKANAPATFGDIKGLIMNSEDIYNAYKERIIKSAEIFAAYEQLIIDSKKIFEAYEALIIDSDDIYAASKERIIGDEEIFEAFKELIIDSEYVFDAHKELIIASEEIFNAYKERIIAAEDIFEAYRERIIKSDEIFAAYRERIIKSEEIFNAYKELIIKSEEILEAYYKKFLEKLVDYVAEEGTAEGWTFKKWKKGSYEMRGRFEIKPTSSTKGEILYITNAIQLPTPFAINDDVLITGMGEGDFWLAGGVYDAEAGKISFKIISDKAMSTTEKSAVRLHVVGTYPIKTEEQNGDSQSN